MSQKVYCGNGSIKELENILINIGSQKFMLVCDNSYSFLPIKEYISHINVPFVVFNEFTSNPLYDDVVKGVDLFNGEHCDTIVAVGGGSSIDVAKCIKLYCKLDRSKNYLQQEYVDTTVPLIAIPTTAGTGSESTRYAVIYYNGQKQSVTHGNIVPNYAILESSVLKTLPVYQKKCTMLDALCQGIESWWSVNSTDESKEYSKMVIETIIENYEAYIFDNNETIAEKIMLASNYAGRAINITQTTAPHAMSYKITSTYGVPHGHAVAICLPHIWRYMVDNLDECIDDRGKDYLLAIFNDIASALGKKSVVEAIDFWAEFLDSIGIYTPKNVSSEDYDILSKSVNITRLKNNPIELTEKNIYDLYIRILNKEVNDDET